MQINACQSLFSVSAVGIARRSPNCIMNISRQVKAKNKNQLNSLISIELILAASEVLPKLGMVSNCIQDTSSYGCVLVTYSCCYSNIYPLSSFQFPFLVSLLKPSYDISLCLPLVRSGRKGRRRVFSLSEADSHGGHWVQVFKQQLQQKLAQYQFRQVPP